MLLANSSGWFKNFLTVAFFTGMRTGELMALEWQDVDFVKKTIRVSKSISHGVLSETKTRESRVVDMLGKVEDALKAQYLLNGLKHKNVFTTKQGNGYHAASTINNLYWKPLLKRCGYAYIDMYNTRHTFASLMLSYGEDMMWVSKMLGHKHFSTTDKYYAKFVNEAKTERAKFLNNDSFDIECGINLTYLQKSSDLKKRA